MIRKPSERTKLVYDRHTSGESLTKIARELGISHGRAGQLKKKYEKHLVELERRKEDWDGITWSQRTINSLIRLGIRNLSQLKDEIAKGIERGHLGWCIANRTSRNLGDEAWLGEILPFLQSTGFEWRDYYTGKTIIFENGTAPKSVVV